MQKKVFLNLANGKKLLFERGTHRGLQLVATFFGSRLANWRMSMHLRTQKFLEMIAEKMFYDPLYRSGIVKLFVSHVTARFAG